MFSSFLSLVQESRDRASETRLAPARRSLAKASAGKKVPGAAVDVWVDNSRVAGPAAAPEPAATSDTKRRLSFTHVVFSNFLVQQIEAEMMQDSTLAGDTQRMGSRAARLTNARCVAAFTSLEVYEVRRQRSRKHVLG